MDLAHPALRTKGEVASPEKAVGHFIAKVFTPTHRPAHGQITTLVCVVSVHFYCEAASPGPRRHAPHGEKSKVSGFPCLASTAIFRKLKFRNFVYQNRIKCIEVQFI